MSHRSSQSQPGGPFPCGYFGCNKTFTRRTGARRHETTVHGDKKYCCNEPDCNYRGGKRRNDFEKHMKKKHPGHDNHLFVPDNLSNPQGSQFHVAHYSQSPEINYFSQVSGNFSPTPPLPSINSNSRFNPIDTNKKPVAATMAPMGSASFPQFHGSTFDPNITPLRPPDTRIFQVIDLPRPEFEPLPGAASEIGNTWSQFNASTICHSESTFQNINDAGIMNDYETYNGDYDTSRYAQSEYNRYYR